MTSVAMFEDPEGARIRELVRQQRDAKVDGDTARVAAIDDELAELGVRQGSASDDA